MNEHLQQLHEDATVQVQHHQQQVQLHQQQAQEHINAIVHLGGRIKLLEELIAGTAEPQPAG